MKISKSWLIKILILILISAGLPYLHITAVRLQDSVAEKRNLIERNPDDLVYGSAASAELAKRQLDIQRVNNYIPDRGSLAAVVTGMEQEGAKKGISISVTDVKEELIINSAGQPAPAPGPIQNIRMKITGTGEPASLAQLLYSLEHLPYLAHFASWDLVNKPQDPADGSQLDLPPNERARTDSSPGAMQADIILATKKAPSL